MNNAAIEKLKELKDITELASTAPTLLDMPRRTLADKGIGGPTSAHVIEEIHTPHNFAYVAITTGTSAFQNIVGVTECEIHTRVSASERAFEAFGIAKAASILISYPPLVNVFSKKGIEGYNTMFLRSSCRESLIIALCEEKPSVVIGDSSFLRAALTDAERIGVSSLIPRGIKFIAAGTPLDLELIDTAERVAGGEVHDLYGCQEFGWLCADGIPLRDDISLIKTDEGSELYDLIVGGLPTGDRFPVTEEGHICCSKGKIITYGRERTNPELEATILKSTAAGASTVERAAKGILRIKGKIVRVSADLELNSHENVISLSQYGGNGKAHIVSGEKTGLFGELLRAQMEYQSSNKKDMTWTKTR